jgi:hypothetical protein
MSEPLVHRQTVLLTQWDDGSVVVVIRIVWICRHSTHTIEKAHRGGLTIGLVGVVQAEHAFVPQGNTVKVRLAPV